MYRYRVYNITRESYCIIESDSILEIGQKVLVKFDNYGLDDVLHECKIIEALEDELLN